MTDVAVDNRGQVWVVDQEKCKIYKFTSSLQLLAIHGGEGDQLAHYQFPRGLGFAQAYRWNSQLQRAEPIPEMAEVMLTEEWGATTGVRRLVSGIDLQSHSVAYRPRLQSGAGDMMLGSFFVTDYCDWTMKFYCNSVLQGQIGQVGQVPGLHSFSWLLPAGAPSGVYHVILDVTSMNIDGNDIQRTNYITVNRSIINQLPVVTNIWFPDGDSCFLAFVPRIVKAVASDPDGSISQYVWSVTSPFYGSVLWSAGDSAMVVSEYYSPTNFGYLGLVVRDNFSEASAAYTLNMSAITRYSASECICTWRPGDADWSHAVSVADAVYIINYVFSGGPSPRPVMMAGDADCNAAISLADAVYVINYIYSGGQPIQCTCSDY